MVGFMPLKFLIANTNNNKKRETENMRAKTWRGLKRNDKKRIYDKICINVPFTLFEYGIFWYCFFVVVVRRLCSEFASVRLGFD